MADGVRLGGAFYELSANAAPLIKSMAEAEARAKATNQAIAQATGLPEKAVQRLGATYIREQKRMADASAAATLRIIKAHNDAAAAADRAAQQQAKSAQQAAAGFASITKGALGFAAAATGVAGAAVLISQAMENVAEQTQKAAQAQFALNATYRTSAATFAEFTQKQAEATKRTNAEVQESVVAFGSLANRYAFTTEQIKELTKRSADLAAVKGITLVDAAKRVAAAQRGEAEAAEEIGLTLNSDYLKKFADMTAEQRKNWETLDPLIKAQITYRETLKQTDQFVGQAEKRTKEAAGATDNLKTSYNNLATAIGKNATPAMQQSAGWLDKIITKANELLEVNRKLAAEQGLATPFAADAPVNNGRSLPGDIPGLDPGMPGSGRPTPAQIDALDAGRKELERRAAERREQIKRDLEAAEKANDATAESAIKAIDKERKEKERWYDEERDRIQARRTYQLEDIETRRDAAIAALEDEKRAAREALEGQIEEQERLKDARLEAAEAAAEAAKAAIDAEKDRLEIAREAEDRERNDTRRREDQNREGIRRTEDRQIEDARRRQDRAAEEAQESEITRLERLRDARADAIEDDIERFEAASQRKLRALDREADRARANSDKALRELERRGEKEDEQHRTRMQALEDEQDARLGILDAQLKALDAQEKSADAAERVAGIQKRLSDAQREATAARGTGTPEQIQAARGDLTRAIRSGDPIAEANARERLVQLAGKGNEAIKKADEDLAEAQADLRKEGVDQARDAERDKLKAAQDAIKADIEARKRAADEENRQRKQSLEREQEAERDKLKSRLDRLERQKQAAQDEAKEEIGRLRDSLEAERQSAQGQIEITRQRFEAAKEVLAQERIAEDRKREDYRREEDRVRAEERLAQDRYRQDERAEQDKALATQLAAVNATLAQERKDTELHFNGPNGTITQLRKAIEDSELLYSRRLAAARAAYEAERKEAERVYTNPEGNGLLQLLEKARQSEFDKLEASKTQWQEWAKAASEAIKAAMADLDTFIARGAAIPNLGVGQTGSGSRAAGSGAATSASAATTRSARSGKDVKGTLGTWINDAMDITGVGDDWAKGLFELAQKESGGDPHARNASGASGLFQTIPSTFRAYRDKNLPDDIFDPVANAVAAIRYIQQEYLTGRKTGYPVDIDTIVRNHGRQGTFWERGYDAGGMIREPVIGRGMRSGRSYAFAEYGPEYVVGRQATARMMARSSIGPGPGSLDYAAMGAFMSAAHPGGNSRTSNYREGDINVYGGGTEELLTKIIRQQHRRRLLQRRPA